MASEAGSIDREGPNKVFPVSNIVEGISVAIGGTLIILAWLANHAWLDRHLLPQMFMPRREQVAIWACERAVIVVLGLVLIFWARPRLGRIVRAGRGRDLALSTFAYCVAGILSLLASEAVLRTGNWERLERWVAWEEPLRHADPLLGWVNVPNRVGFETYKGHAVRYDLDPQGRRVDNIGHKLDPRRASILFTGESILFGFRLNWNETAAAQIGAASGLQTVNISVNGYGADQELLRLQQELPHFAQPKVVVALFAPMMIERSLDRHRPRLDAGLRWHPQESGWRLSKLFRKLLLYHSANRIDAGVAASRASLVAIVKAAQIRGARPLILVPEFGPDQPIEKRLREKVLAGLPYIRVELNPDWTIPDDGHPNAYANVVMRRAVLTALKIHSGR